MLLPLATRKLLIQSIWEEKKMGAARKTENIVQMVNVLKFMYSSVQVCVRWGASLSEFFECFLGVKEGCLFSPLIFSLLVSEVADSVRKIGKHGIQLLPGFKQVFYCYLRTMLY